MDKEIEAIYLGFLKDLFNYDSCPNCNGNSLIYEIQKYEFVKFDINDGLITITDDNFDLDSSQERIMCLNCNWEEEFD